MIEPKVIKRIVEYLQSIIDCDPRINPQDMGECIYCRAALDEAKPHNEGCHYLKAQELLKEFQGMS